MTPAQAAIITRHAMHCPVQREAVARAIEERDAAARVSGQDREDTDAA